MNEEKTSDDINQDQNIDEIDDDNQDNHQKIEKKDDTKDLLKQIEEYKIKSDEYKDKYVRSLAEIDNLQKRHEKDMSQMIKYILESFAKDLVPVLDSFENALKNSKNDLDEKEKKSILEGMTMLHKQMIDVLKSNGIKEIDTDGNFDPNYHQAINKIESEDADSETIAQVFAKGYEINGRLLRPAMVSVKVPKTKDCN